MNLILAWHLFQSSKNNLSFSWPSVQIKKTLSMYRNHTKGLYTCHSRKSVSTSSINLQGYGGANLVAMAVGASGSLRKSLFNLIIKFKVVAFHNKFCHFSKVLSTDFFYLLDYQAFSLKLCSSVHHHEGYWDRDRPHLQWPY